MSAFSRIHVGRAAIVTLASLLLLAVTPASTAGVEPTTNGAVQAFPPIKLIYDEQLIREGFPSPAVRVTIGEITAWLLVDTGAGVHTLASWFVHDAGIQGSAATVNAKDSTGREVSMRVARDIRLKIDGVPALSIPEAAIADFPAAFQRLRIAGLLSPQLLAGAGTVSVLDLRAPSLQIRLDSSGGVSVASDSVTATACRVDTSPFRNLLFGLSATVGGISAALTLDTGASATILDMSRPVAKNLHDLRPDGFESGVSGVREPIFRSAPITVEFGGRARTIPVRVGVPQGGCGVDGLIGMDAVRGCVLTMSDRAVTVTCDPLPGTADSRRD